MEKCAKLITERGKPFECAARVEKKGRCGNWSFFRKTTSMEYETYSFHGCCTLLEVSPWGSGPDKSLLLCCFFALGAACGDTANN